MSYAAASTSLKARKLRPEVLSKLVWALQSNSELRRRDIRQLLVGSIDLGYIRKWAQQLSVTKLLDELPQ